MLENVSELIHNKRKSMNLTIETLSEKANVSVSLISKIERGNINNISVQKLDNIATSLNLTLGDLFIDSDLADVETLELIRYLKSIPKSRRKLISQYVLKLLVI